MKAKLTAAGVPLMRDDPAEIVAIFPDKVKVEFYAAPTLSVPLEHFHVHFYATDPDALRAWYVKHFGAAMPTPANANAAGVPGIAFSFRKTDTPQAATKGRSLDHIGFEVKDLEAFCKKLAADGVTFESPFRDVPAHRAEDRLPDRSRGDADRVDGRPRGALTATRRCRFSARGRRCCCARWSDSAVCSPG